MTLRQPNIERMLQLGLSGMAEALEEQRVAGLAPWRGSVHERSMNASSTESGSTRGVRPSIIARTSRPTAVYFFILGLMTVTAGQALRALNIGMAERTP